MGGFNNFVGYNRGIHGALSDTGVEVGGTTYTVSGLFYVSGNDLSIVFNPRPPNTETDTWTLHIGASSFNFSEATYAFDALGHQFAWSSHGLSWTTNQKVFPKIFATANNPPSFTSNASFSAAENQTAVGTVVATDDDTDDSVTGYALTGGADQAKFSITTGGVLTFKTAPDHENPADVASTTPMNAAGNNEYVVQVTATSGTGGRAKTTSQVITVRVTDVRERASFSVASLSATTAENAEWVSAAPTTTGDAPIGDLTWTKDVVGADEDRFTLAGATGVLTLPAQDYENPADAGTYNTSELDNEYEIFVIATDEDGNTAEWEVVVEVTDVMETRTFTVTGVPASVNVAENAEW